MGLKRRDDDANRIGALTREFPQLALCLGAHTHQNHPGEIINNVLYTQADHFGIYAGKVDLTFDRNTRKLLHREAVTVPMDSAVPLDPLVLSMARADLDHSAEVLARPIGELTEPFGIDSTPGSPSEIERLIGSAMASALDRRGYPVDVVIHGLFDNEHPLSPGTKTVADAWNLLPYENEIVTVDLSLDDLRTLADDFSLGTEARGVMTRLLVLVSSEGRTGWNALPGVPIKPIYRVAINSYDSQSGGGRFQVAARIVARASSRRILHPVQVRDSLIDFFATRKKIGKSSLLV
jgi:hypothetical protein